MHTCHCCLSEVKTVLYVYAPIKTKRFWWTWSWSLVGCSVLCAISEEAEHINARRQLNMYLLYVTNCYSSLDSTVICFSQHFPIVFPTSFFVLCLLHFRRPYAHFLFQSILTTVSLIWHAMSVFWASLPPLLFRWWCVHPLFLSLKMISVQSNPVLHLSSLFFVFFWVTLSYFI